MSRDRLIAELEKRTGLPSPAVGRLLDELVSLACEEASRGFIIPGLCEIRLVPEELAGEALQGKGASGLKKLTIVPLPAAVELAKRADGAAARDTAPAPAASAPESSAGDPFPAVGGAKSAMPDTSSEEVLPPGLYSFPCPACGALVDAVPSMAGAKADCPFCARVLRVPYPTSKVGAPQGPATSGEAAAFFSLNCTHCGEEMEMRSNRLGSEVDCPFCGAKLRVQEGARRSPPPGEKSNAARPGGGASEGVFDRLMHRTAPPIPMPSPAAGAGPRADIKLTNRS